MSNEIKFKNDSKIIPINASNKRGKRSELLSYIDDVDRYISSLSDEEFMKILIECGLENCPYDSI